MTNSQLAKRVIRQVRALTPKLKELEADLRRLWVAFEKLKPGEKILGCRTKAQFCEKKLSRSPRAIQYLLYGRTTEERPERAERMEDARQANNVRVEEGEVLPPLAVVGKFAIRPRQDGDRTQSGETRNVADFVVTHPNARNGAIVRSFPTQEEAVAFAEQGDDPAQIAKAEAMHRMIAYLDRFEGEEFEVQLDDFIKDLRKRCARSLGATA